jgi:hypothetical protein
MVKDYSLYGKKHLQRDFYNKIFLILILISIIKIRLLLMLNYGLDFYRLFFYSI